MNFFTALPRQPLQLRLSGCAPVSDQERLFTLLDPSRIGCELTENHQMDPRRSTTRSSCTTEAKYFNV